jgi:hypothetical protein
MKGDPTRTIPRETTYNLVAHGAMKRDGVRQINRGTCTKSLSIDLDPGKYTILFKKDSEADPRLVDYYWVEDFYVDVDAEGFRRLSGIKPKTVTTIQSADGPRWNCNISGCQESTMTEYSAVVHEAKHNGFDLEKKSELDRFLGIVPKQVVIEPPLPKVSRT